MTVITEGQEMRIVVDASVMPHSTQFRRIQRGTEELYYLLLFSSSADYRDRREVWKEWADTGFSTALQDAPFGVQSGDRIHISMRSDGKRFVLTARSSNKGALAALEQLLRHLDALRTKGDPEALTHDESVTASLVEPVVKAVAGASLRDDEAVLFTNAIERDLLAWVHPQITNVNIGITLPTGP
jgi:hypothetical protein